VTGWVRLAPGAIFVQITCAIFAIFTIFTSFMCDEADRQIQKMLDNGIIRPSHSPMASPLVCVLKGKEGCDGVRLAVDYRYVNRFTRDDA